MLAGEKLRKELSVIPEYDNTIRKKQAVERLMALSDIYKIYIPSDMTVEIYSKIYLSMIRSLQKKQGRTTTMQKNQNFRMINQEEYRGIIGGSDSYTIIGNSGVGKSSAIMRSLTLATENKIMEIDNPYMKIVPCIICQCPHDASVKGMLLEILRKTDEAIGSNYHQQAIRARATTDMLIGSVSQAALNHIGLLVVDEIQNVYRHRSGHSLISMLTQLINNSGISIAMVGTPECSQFFESEMQLARRSLGLKYTVLPYDNYFKEFCKTVFNYQYVKNKTNFSDSIAEWLYEHSGGIISLVISLIHDAQEIAILKGTERLDINALNEAYKERFEIIRDYIKPSVIKNRQTGRIRKEKIAGAIKDISECNFNFKDTVAYAKANDKNVVELLKQHIAITEVAV